MTAQIKKSVTHDKISLSASFPSGAKFKWTISRGSESVMIAFSSDKKTADQQHKVIADYMAQLEGTNIDRVDKISELFSTCKSGSEVVGKMLNAISPKIELN